MPRKNQPKRPIIKIHGERGEIVFLHRAHGYDLVLSRPFGDVRYDWIVEGRRLRRRKRPLNRVQVKAVWYLDGNRYTIRACASGYRPYLASEIEFLAAYIGPEDLWYIIPVEKLRKRKTFHIYIRRPDPAWLAPYREAWQQLF